MFKVLPALRGRYRMNRALQAAVLFVLLLRGLLSGAVMFDVQPSSGNVGLVLCSGAGAMFRAGSDASGADDSGRAVNDDAMAGMRAMPLMPMNASPQAIVPVAPHEDAAAAAQAAAAHPGAEPAGMDSGICAFSAALCLALVALTRFSVPLPALRRLACGVRPIGRAIGRVIAYRFALSRAPPSRSLLP